MKCSSILSNFCIKHLYLFKAVCFICVKNATKKTDDFVEEQEDEFSRCHEVAEPAEQCEENEINPDETAVAFETDKEEGDRCGEPKENILYCDGKRAESE